MSGLEHPILPETVRREERKIFRRSATMDLSNGLSAHVKTFDISPSGLCIMTGVPLLVGDKVVIGLSVTIDAKVVPLQLKGTVRYCILSGTEGFRVGLALIENEAENKNYIEKIMSNQAF